MGHHTVEAMIFGNMSLGDAYNSIRDRVEWDDDWQRHGEGARLSQYAGEPIPSDDRNAIREMTNRLDSETSSYSPAVGVPVIKVEPGRYEGAGVKEVLLDFNAAELNQDNVSWSNVLTDAGVKKVAKHLGVKVDEIYSVGLSTRYDAPKRKYVLKFKAETGAGKAETRYFVVAKEKSDRMPVWADGFPSQAAARASISGTKEVTTGYTFYRSGDFEIIGMTRREDGGALVKSSSCIAKASLSLEVQLQRKVSSRKVTNERGWLIVGSVHV